MKTLREMLLALGALLIVHSAAQALEKGPVHSAILERVSGGGEWERVEVEDVRVQNGARVPEGAAFDVVGESVPRPLGYKEFQLKERGDRSGRTILASAFIRAYNTVYYLSRSVGRGERIKAEDLVAGEMDVTRIPRDAVRNPEELEGRVVSRTLPANTLLCQSQFRREPIARRGDRVILVAGSGAVQAAVPGVLREDGHQGGWVRAANLMTGKEISGWLVDAGTVKVGF